MTHHEPVFVIPALAPEPLDVHYEDCPMDRRLLSDHVTSRHGTCRVMPPSYQHADPRSARQDINFLAGRPSVEITTGRSWQDDIVGADEQSTPHRRSHAQLPEEQRETLLNAACECIHSKPGLYWSWPQLQIDQG